MCLVHLHQSTKDNSRFQVQKGCKCHKSVYATCVAHFPQFLKGSIFLGGGQKQLLVAKFYGNIFTLANIRNLTVIFTLALQFIRNTQIFLFILVDSFISEWDTKGREEYSANWIIHGYKDSQSQGIKGICKQLNKNKTLTTVWPTAGLFCMCKHSR